MNVRQATPDDKPAIFAFIRRAFASREQYKIPHRWQWQFEDNPFRDDQALPVWIALDGNSVVGQSGAMIEPLKLGERELKVGWSVDTVVLPEYRGRGLGQRLQAANQAAHEVFMSLKMSEQNARIKTRLGGFALPAVALLKLRLSTDRAVVTERLQRSSRLVAGAASATGTATLAAAMLSASAQRRWSKAARNVSAATAALTIDEVSQFGDELVPLWRELAAAYDLLVCREPGYLNWKFARQPHMDHHRFVARRVERVVGYVVLRPCRSPEPNIGVIAELAAAPADAGLLRELIIFAVDWFRDRGIALVKAASSDERFTTVYESLGFTTHRRLTPICHLRDATTGFTPGACHPFFTYGDHDLDQVPLTN